jgi:hypothetical protein
MPNSVPLWHVFLAAVSTLSVMDFYRNALDVKRRGKRVAMSIHVEDSEIQRSEA